MKGPWAKASPATRPLGAVAPRELAARFAAALAQGDGLTGAHCVHELWMRGEYPTRIERALARLWAVAAPSIPDWLPMRYIDWLPTAYAVAARERAPTRGARRGRSCVYLVLLDCSDRTRGPFGVYVGMTAHTPAQRFDQHKAGIRASGAVLKRGLELLTGPTLHLRQLARADAARIEASLARALADAGLIVEGGH